MNSDYENLLERRIQSELKSVPALKAPSELHARVMAAIEAKQTRKQNAWSTWPVGLKAATMLLLVAGFAAICFLSWQLRQADAFSQMTQSFTSAWAPFATALNLCQTLLLAIVLAVKNLSQIVLIGLMIAAALAYFTWFSLGTLWFRIAFARH